MSAAVKPIRPSLATAEVTRWRKLLDVEGTLVATTWETLFDDFAKVRLFAGDDHDGWSAAVFEGDKRAKASVLRVTAAVLDYDGTASIQRALESWAGVYGFLHTTKKHRDEAPRFRVVLPLKRPVSVYEWDLLWQRLQEHIDGAADGAAKDASRFWYTPGIPNDGEFYTARLEGAALDPDDWLRKLPKQATTRDAPGPSFRTPNDPQQIESRAIKYISKMEPSIAGTGGDKQLFRVAIELARGFALDEATTLRILRNEFNPRCQPPWDDNRLAYKAKSAISANVPLGYRLENDRATWTAPESYYNESQDTPPEWLTDDDDPGPDPEAEQPTEDGSAKPGAQVTEPRTMAQMLAVVLDRAKAGQRDVGVSACHYRLDYLLAGFRPKMITVMGARTSFGKTTYAIMVADEAMRRGEGVLFVSAEDGEELYGQRFMARRAKVNAYKLRANTCEPDELVRMEQQARIAERIPFFVDAIGKTAEWIGATIRKECKARPIKLVVVDYLQRISTARRTQDKRTEVTLIMSTVADAIKESNTAGLVLSQLKRLDGGGDREPGMSDLKESGDIENMAEHVVLGWVVDPKTEAMSEDEAPPRERYLKVEKNKDGPVDTRRIDLPFDEATASFRAVLGEQQQTKSVTEYRFNPDAYEPGQD